MKGIVAGLMLVLVLAGAARAEPIAGQVVLHDTAGKVIGLAAPDGLVAVVYDGKVRVTGLASLALLKKCDEVKVDATWKGKRRVISSLAVQGTGDAGTCPLLVAPNVTSADLSRVLADKSATVVDVRSGKEYRKAHFAGAANIPLGELEGRIAELPPDKPTILYGASRLQVLFAAVLLKQKGVKASVVKGTFTAGDGAPRIIEK